MARREPDDRAHARKSRSIQSVRSRWHGRSENDQSARDREEARLAGFTRPVPDWSSADSAFADLAKRPEVPGKCRCCGYELFEPRGVKHHGGRRALVCKFCFERIPKELLGQGPGRLIWWDTTKR